MLNDLKKRVLEANLELVRQGLVIYTWGNVSGIDPNREYMVIKPSGVDYGSMTVSDMAVVDVRSGKVVEGDRRPSSDTPTHLELYRKYPNIGGVVHTHSVHAVAFAQAGLPIQALGTTHADYFCGDIPCTRALTREETQTEYEANTGKVIVETFSGLKADPMAIPGVVVKNHGPFSWGKDPEEAVYHAAVMEKVAEMNLKTLLLNPNASMETYLLEKHFKRKHGPEAYYGQKQ